MSETIQAYPLQWPIGRPRQHCRERAPFKVTMGRSLDDIRDEIRMLGGSNVVVSTNMPVRQDGMPYATKRIISDAGAAVYFTYKGRPVCFACDRWRQLEDNLRAISLTINALRGIARWGTGDMVAAAFTGFTALPSPEQWFQVLGVPAAASKADITAAHRRLAMEHHPDRGGDHHQMARINQARDDGLEQARA
jgi:hypothetical protein